MRNTPFNDSLFEASYPTKLETNNKEPSDFFLRMNANTPDELLSSPVIGAIDGDIMMDAPPPGPADFDQNEDEASIFSDIVAETKMEATADTPHTTPHTGKSRHRTTNDAHGASPSHQRRHSEPPHPDAFPDSDEEAERIRKRGWKEHDVPLGRSQEVREFVGNIRYRGLVEEHRPAYHSAAKRADKTAISNTIFGIIKGRGGRFLDKKVDKKSGTETWFEIPQEKALAKVSQALRVTSTAQSAIQQQKQQQQEQAQQQHYAHYHQPASAAMTYPGGGFVSTPHPPSGAAYPGDGVTAPAASSLPMSPPRSMTGMEISVPQDHASPMSPHFYNNSSSNTMILDHSSTNNTQSTTHHNSGSVYMPHWGETSQGALSEESSSAGSKRRRNHPTTPTSATAIANPRPDLFRHRSDDAMMNFLVSGATPVRANLRRRQSEQPARPRRGGRRPSRTFAKAQIQQHQQQSTDEGDDWKIRQSRSYSEGQASWDLSEEESMDLDTSADATGHWPSSSWNLRACHSFTEGEQVEGYRLQQQLQRRRTMGPSLEEHFSRFRPHNNNYNSNEEDDFQNISSSISEELAVDKLVQELDLEPIPVPTVGRRAHPKKKKSKKGSSSGTPSVSKSV